MKQLAQYQNGRLELQEVPTPNPPPGGILVRVTHSVISPGTEKMKVTQARMNLVQKAMARPDQVRKVLDTARTLGWRSAMEKVRNRLSSPTPLGYSLAGVVTAVDDGNTRFRVGDRVACAGAECAHHAEMVAVPDFLAASIPDGVDPAEAAYTTICSIALQALRQLEATPGERILILGQGLVGLLATNLARIAGLRVLATDLMNSRLEASRKAGAERTVHPGEEDLAAVVRDWTGGFGVDGVLLCTATSSNAPLEQAAAALRDRGRMVVVGMTKADLDWRIFYEKELEVRYSRSYGPGRYDPGYEWGGSDYPIGYVRWTEQRNFDACLAWMASGDLKPGRFTTRRVRFAEAAHAYDALAGEGSEEIGVVLDYTDVAGDRTEANTGVASTELSEKGREVERLATPVERVDVVGAGNFARTMLLPHLKGRLGFGTICNQTSLSTRHVGEKFGFEETVSDADEVLAREGGAVLIATRHHLHGPQVRRALQAGRHVFVEKPLCLREEELAGIGESLEASSGSVMVGFNRRFAPAAVEMKRLRQKSPGPASVSFRVFAGPLQPDHWYANYEESGGRVLGEACHFLDYFCWLFEAPPTAVFAQPLGAGRARLPFPDSVAAQVEFADGSSGQLIYTGEGDFKYPKEMATLYAEGLVAEIENFQELRVYEGRKLRKSRFGSKGHAEEMAAWGDFLLGQRKHPMAWGEVSTSMRLTFALLRSIRERRAVSLTAGANGEMAGGQGKESGE